MNQQWSRIWFVMHRGILGLSLATLLGQGCAINPVTGRPDFVLVTAAGEREIGRDAALEVEQSMGLVNDPELTAYVEAVGQRLAEHSPRKDVDYTFHVVEMAEPNAFALPGGYVYVSRGLLALANSEDELANVIGHEIGHVAARHSVKRISAAAPFAVVAGIAGGVTGMVSDHLGSAVGAVPQLAGSVVLAPYSRDQEREADRVGIEMAAGAGWDPKAMSKFLHSLEREDELKRGYPRKASFFDSHPATPERVDDTAQHAKDLARAPSRPITADRAAFLAKLDGLVVGKNPAEGVFVENRFLHPDLGFTVAFPPKWETQNTRQFAVASEPDSLAFALLQVAAEGDDPLAAPRALEKKSENKLVDKVEQFKINGLPAARLVLQLRTSEGPMAAAVTWVAYEGLVYQIMGVCPASKFEGHRNIFSEVAGSFRPLTSSERAGIEVTRLRVALAREGETLEQLIARTGSAWTRDEAEVINGLQSNSRMKNGHLVKVAIQERYVPR